MYERPQRKAIQPYTFTLMNLQVLCYTVNQGRSQVLPPIEMLFQVFKLDSWILAEMCLKCIILVTDFQKLPSAGALCPKRLLIFNFVELKLRNLAKLWFFKLTMTKSNFKKSIMTSF